MKIKLAIILLGLTIAGSAMADARISSVASEELTITFDAPSGETMRKVLGSVGGSASTDSVLAENGKLQAIVVTNATGATVAKGSVTNDKSYMLMPAANGQYQLVQSGVGYQGDKFPGVVIVSALPENYTVDLFGTNGKYGVKGIVPSSTFDIKNVTRLTSTDEDRYKVVIHLPDGSTVVGNELVYAGYYQVLFLTREHTVSLSSVGSIAPVVTPAVTPTTKPAVKAGTPAKSNKKKKARTP